MSAATELVAAAGMRRVDLDLRLPSVMGAWSLTGSVGLRKELGDRWPACADQLTGMIRKGLELAEEFVDLDALVNAENRRLELNEAMADMFDQVDILIAATNPSTAFDAEGRLPSVFGGRESTPGNNGALTTPSNIYGNPAISLPARCGQRRTARWHAGDSGPPSRVDSSRARCGLGGDATVASRCAQLTVVNGRPN